ncbi:MAG: Txe/YoeB family addiction module toxin [Bradyrhizobium sp.]|jgi:toxin YoeB
MKTAWTEDSWRDYLYWQQTDEKILNSINDLIKDIKRDPFKGLGKPEPLKHTLQGWWSRRISGEHRLVYRVSGKDDNQQLDIVQCRYHY